MDGRGRWARTIAAVPGPVPPSRVAPVPARPPGGRRPGRRAHPRRPRRRARALAGSRLRPRSSPSAPCASLIAAGGKRLRPAFCHWAFVGAGGDPDDPRVVSAGAALELLHTFALVHDDVMDGSDQRRGLPSVHRAFIDRHVGLGWQGDARRSGEGAAILVGDFAFVYADLILGEIPPEARAIFDELRLELCVGQYLDLVGTASGSRDPEQATRIERYKSSKYTVERPLHLGAALAGAEPDVHARAHRGRPAPGRGLPDARRPPRCLRRQHRHRQARGRRPARGQADPAPRRGGVPGDGSGAEAAARPGGRRRPRPRRRDRASRTSSSTSGAVAEIEDRIEACVVAEALAALDRAPITAEARDRAGRPHPVRRVARPLGDRRGAAR